MTPPRSRRLKRGEMPIFEPGLAELVARTSRANRLSFTTDLAGAAKARGRRLHRRRHAVAARRRPCRPHLRVSRRRREIAPHLDGYKVIVTKSTVPVGTGDEVARIVARGRGRTPSSPSSPTRSSCARAPPSADFMRPDRVVIGTDDERARQDVMRRALPARCSSTSTPIVFTGAAHAPS